MTYRNKSILDMGFTDQEIRDYIKSEISDISYKDMMKIRDEFLNNCISLHTAIELFKSSLKIKKME